MAEIDPPSGIDFGRDKLREARASAATGGPAATKNRGVISRRDSLTKELHQTCRLDGTLDLTAAQATGANVHTLRGTIHYYANVLSVGSPSTTGLAVGMADVVAIRHSLVTYLTELAH